MSSPSQLFSCVDANAILKSPNNRSTAKNHWSFSKAARFPNYKLQCDAMYDLPSTKSKRKTSLGYGKKTDLQHGKHRHNITPSPDTYDLKSFVQANKLHEKGPTPGKGRQQTAPISYIPIEPQKMPGSGTYSPKKFKQTPYWSMRPKTSSDLFPSTTQKLVPGPGRYESAEDFHKTGKYHTAKFKSSGSKVFNPPRSQRFFKSTTDAPGAGTYHPQNDLSSQGKYVLSKNVSDGKRMMLKSDRDSFVDEDHKRTQTPGPGTYRPPSDFGHYDDPPIHNPSLMVRTAHSKFRR